MKTYRLSNRLHPWLWSLLVLLGVSSTPAAEITNRAVRLAVMDFETGPVTMRLRARAGTLADTLVSKLSSERGFELIERTELDRMLREASISLSGRVRPADAVRAGKLLRADWLVLGSFLRLDATNMVLCKIVDAQTGVLRDLTIQSFPETNIITTAEVLAAFITASRQPAHRLNERLYLGIGAFDDLSQYRRHPEFSEQFGSALSRRFQGSHVLVVERAQVSPLLNELRLSMGGFTAEKSSGPTAQAAFVLVDGLYQSFRDEQTKINLVLRIEPVGGQLQTVSLKEIAGPALEGKVVEAIERALRELKLTNAAPSRRKESLAQQRRGVELARLSDRSVTRPFSGSWPMSYEEFSKVEPSLRQAVQAFESALLLNPENEQAKLYLAYCLAKLGGADREQARRYWQEVAVSTTNTALARTARESIAYSYNYGDDLLAAELTEGLARSAPTFDESATYSEKLFEVNRRLCLAKKMPADEYLKRLKELWRIQCRQFLQRIELKQHFSEDDSFAFHLQFFDPPFPNQSEAMREFAGDLMSDLIVEFPQLEPYLLAGHIGWLSQRAAATPEWLSRFDKLLEQSDRNPASILASSNYFSGTLWSTFMSLVSRQETNLARRVGLVLQHQRHLVRNYNLDRLDLHNGYLHFGRGEWNEALAAFERIGARSVQPGARGPWGKEPNVTVLHIADDCRRKLGQESKLRTISLPSISSPAPLGVFSGPELYFAVDGGRVWVLDDTGLYKYEPGTGPAKRIEIGLQRLSREYPQPYNILVSSIELAAGKVWIGTRTNGLIAFDQTTGAISNYNVGEGLLMPNVSALLPAGNRLWIGFGNDDSRLGLSPGGLGFLDLVRNEFVGLEPEFPKGLSRAPARGATDRHLSVLGDAPRFYITKFARSPKGLMWALTRYGIIEFPATQTNSWKRLTNSPASVLTGHAPGIVANDRYLAVVAPDPTGLAIYSLPNYQCRYVKEVDGLPNNSLRSIALDGDKAWVGGKGYVALVDLPSARVEKVCKLRATFSVRSMRFADGNVWFSCGPALYRMPANAN